jgi:uncharacterized membrane protein
MSKLEYLDALKRAMAGLPPETIAKTLGYYEQRFVDGEAAGQTEAAIAEELGDPKKIAISLRTNVHLKAFEEKRNPATLLRLMVSVVGLAIFNLFMVVPALVYGALLSAMYACAFAFYVAGIAITASGMSGANELVLTGPFHELIANDDSFRGDTAQTRVSISESGIRVFQENSDTPAPADEDADDSDGASKVIKHAEAVAGRGLHISTSLDDGSRATQSFFGIGMVLAGILLFLLGLVVTKYTLIGIKRYLEMNFALLKGN